MVGGGPKALFALQELHDRLPTGADVAVDVFDTAELGGGAVWRPELPPSLRMNSPASAVDARFSRFRDSLTDWLARAHPGHVGETYVPRRIAGAYLREAYAALAASDRMTVRHVRRRITGLTGVGEAGPDAANDSAALDATAYDEVLLATGHAGPPSDLHERAAGVSAGAVAVIRGAALTGLDAVALLTEGRGGTWEPIPDDPAGFLTYAPSGREPRLIRVVSRSGTVMSPKPDASHPLVTRETERAAAEVRAWGTEGRPEFGLDPLWRTVLAAAERLLAASGIRTSPLRLWRTLLTGRPSRDDGTWAALQQMEFLRTRVEIDAGLRAPDESWALGRVWFELFPETVRAIDRRALTRRDRARLGRVLAHQERASFGPSGQTARRLVALADAGLLEFAAGSPDPSECLDAVTIGPGAVRVAGGTEFLDPLFADLHERGLITIRRGDRGVLTAPDGTVLRPDGGCVERLAVIGRPTEGPVLGNDTLDRTLHADGTRWAAAVAARAALSTR